MSALARSTAVDQPLAAIAQRGAVYKRPATAAAVFKRPASIAELGEGSIFAQMDLKELRNLCGRRKNEHLEVSSKPRP